MPDSDARERSSAPVSWDSDVSTAGETGRDRARRQRRASTREDRSAQYCPLRTAARSNLGRGKAPDDRGGLVHSERARRDVARAQGGRRGHRRHRSRRNPRHPGGLLISVSIDGQPSADGCCPPLAIRPRSRWSTVLGRPLRWLGRGSMSSSKKDLDGRQPTWRSSWTSSTRLGVRCVDAGEQAGA